MKRYSCTAAFFLLGLCLSASAAQKKRVLSFGGNGNIGSETLTKLIEAGDYDITIVSRENWHFDSETRIKPHVRSVVCDRAVEPDCTGLASCNTNTLTYCEDFMKVVEENEDGWDVVLDFSAFEPKWVQDAVDVLKKKPLGVYIYISSDSIYEVCQAKEPADRPTVETDDVRPADKKKQEQLKKDDTYGHSKLAGEEVLKEQSTQEDGFPYVALRFADVIGPRDTTYRFVLYQFWLKFYHDIDMPIYVPSNIMNNTESLTYVKDAAASVINVLEAGPKAYNQAYNIAMDDKFTLGDIIDTMAEVMGVEDVEQNHLLSNDAFHLYPSVFNGSMDISKAVGEIGFKPTPTKVAFKETVEWYEDQFRNNEAVRTEMITRFMTYAIPREKKPKLYGAIDRELEKAGVKIEKIRRKRKGDLEEFEKDEL